MLAAGRNTAESLDFLLSSSAPDGTSRFICEVEVTETEGFQEDCFRKISCGGRDCPRNSSRGAERDKASKRSERNAKKKARKLKNRTSAGEVLEENTMERGSTPEPASGYKGVVDDSVHDLR
ncbi:hypothetical protein RQP46_004798 [Phenoliferia psychrophenolica]